MIVAIRYAPDVKCFAFLDAKTVTKNRLGWMQSAETQYEAVVTYCER